MRRQLKKIIALTLTFTMILSMFAINAFAVTYRSSRPFRTFYFSLNGTTDSDTSSDLRDVASDIGLTISYLGYIHGGSYAGANSSLKDYWSAVGLELKKDGTAEMMTEALSSLPIYIFLDGLSLKGASSKETFTQTMANTVYISGNTFAGNSKTGTVSSTAGTLTSNGSVNTLSMSAGTLNLINLVLGNTATGGNCNGLCQTGGKASFNNVTATASGYSGGACLSASGTVTSIVNSSFTTTRTNTLTDDAAAAVRIHSGGSITSWTDSDATAVSGDALLLNNATVGNIDGGTFSGGTSGYGIRLTGNSSIGTISSGVFKGSSAGGIYIDTGATVGSITGGTFYGLTNNGTLTSVSGGTFDYSSSTSTYASTIAGHIASGYVAQLTSTDGNGVFAVVKNSGITSGTYMAKVNTAAGYVTKTDTFNGTTVYEVIEKPDIDATAITFDKNIIIADVSEGFATVTATLTPSDATSTVTWSVEDDENYDMYHGTVYFYNWGRTKITARTSNGLTATCELIVTDTSKNYYYISDENYTAPTVTGKLFAGWYLIEPDKGDVDTSVFTDGSFFTDRENFYPQPVQRVDGKLPTGIFAYARYVDADMLGVKAQLQINSVISSETTDMRLISSVDGEVYRYAGFEITHNGTTYESGTQNIYTTLIGGNNVYKPSQIYEGSKYFFIYKITDIPNSEFDIKFSVRPYYVTFDGTKVYGQSVDRTIKNGMGFCEHTHTTAVPAKEPQCIVSGYTAGIYCTDCGSYISGHETIPPTGIHTYGDWYNNGDGTQYHICTVCGDKQTEVFSCNHNNTLTVPAKDANCSEEGYTEGVYCKDCNSYISGHASVPKNDVHVLGKWTENYNGTHSAKCLLCGAVKTETCVCTHSHTEVVPRQACEGTSVGYTEGIYCTDCKQYISGHAEIQPDNNAAVINIGSDRQVFWDDYIVDTSRTDAVLTLNHPTRKEVIFVTDAEWEGDSCDYYNIITVTRDDGSTYYRMYYNAWNLSTYESSADICICAIESEDGITWTRPDYGLYEYNGNTHTNIVMKSPYGFDNFFVFVDTNPYAVKSQKYKAVAEYLGPEGYGDLFYYYSTDGLHWTLGSALKTTEDGTFDSVNTCFYSSVDDKYHLYFRAFGESGRAIVTSSGTNFAAFGSYENSNIRYNDGNSFQMYTNNIQPYYRAPQIFVGFPTRYNDHNVVWEDNMDYLPDYASRLQRYKETARTATTVTDCMFMTSRDGLKFNRFSGAWATPGPEHHGNWVYGDCYFAYGMIETDSGYTGQAREISMYAFEGKFTDEPSKVYRYTTRIDGFASYTNTEYTDKTVTTKAFTFTGTTLKLNFATSGGGSIVIKVLDKDGNAISGYTSYTIFGDQVDREITFGDKEISALQGQDIRLQFTMKDASVYSFIFE